MSFSIIIYILCVITLLIFFILGGYAVYHAFHFGHSEDKVKLATGFFVVSTVAVLFLLFFVISNTDLSSFQINL